MIENAFIYPTAYHKYFEDIEPTLPQMYLFHLRKSELYTINAERARGYKILDNSFYELRESPNSLDLVKLKTFARRINADCVVLPDGTLRGFDMFLAEGFSVMVVPTSFEQLVEFMRLSLKYRKGLIRIGLGGLHAVKMLGLEDVVYTDGRIKTFHFKNRFVVLSRVKRELPELWSEFIAAQKDVGIRSSNLHFLGLGDYPLEELKLLLSLVTYASVDSSAFVWSYLKRGIPWYKLGEKDKLSKISFQFDSKEVDKATLDYFGKLKSDFTRIYDEESLLRSIGYEPECKEEGDVLHL